MLVVRLDRRAGVHRNTCSDEARIPEAEQWQCADNMMIESVAVDCERAFDLNINCYNRPSSITSIISRNGNATGSQSKSTGPESQGWCVLQLQKLPKSRFSDADNGALCKAFDRLTIAIVSRKLQ